MYRRNCPEAELGVFYGLNLQIIEPLQHNHSYCVDIPDLCEDPWPTLIKPVTYSMPVSSICSFLINFTDLQFFFWQAKAKHVSLFCR